MRQVNIHEAKTHLSRLLEQAEKGERILIARAGKPIAVLGPLPKRAAPRKPGLLAGRVRIAKDFDAPLPPDLLSAFHAGEIEPR
jgi:prevent-host-death family protein